MDLFLLQHLALAIGFLFGFVYVPGYILSWKLKLSKWFDLHIVIGLSVLLPSVFLFGRILSIKWLLLIYIIIFLSLGWIWRVKVPVLKPAVPITVLLAILFGSLAQSWHFISTALAGREAITYAVLNSHDQSWHAALIKQILEKIPPQTPGFEGLTLKNYHYFYDLLIAGNVSLFGGDLFVYIQAVYPVLISIFFGFSVFRISSILIRNRKYLIPLAVLYCYFSNSLSYLLGHFGFRNWQSDTLLLDQPLIYLFNQQTVLSISLLLYLYILAEVFFSGTWKRNVGLAMICIASTLMGLKVYAFLVGVISVSLVGLITLITDVHKRAIHRENVVTIVTVICSGLFLCGLIFGLNFSPGKRFLSYNPLWLLDEFFIRNILPYSKDIASQKAIAVLLNNKLKLFFIQVVTGAVFLLSNLHVRVLGLFVSNTKLNACMKIGGIVALASVLMFQQTNSAYNIIQFAPYAVIGWSVLLWQLISKMQNKAFLVISIFLVWSISIPVTLKTISNFGRYTVPRLHTELFESLAQLKQMQKGTVLVLGTDTQVQKAPPLKDPYRTANSISAATGFNTYLFDLTQLEVLQVDYTQRQQYVQYLEEHICSLNEEDIQKIVDEKIRYIMVPNTKTCARFETIINTPDFMIYQVY